MPKLSLMNHTKKEIKVSLLDGFPLQTLNTLPREQPNFLFQTCNIIPRQVSGEVQPERLGAGLASAARPSWL